MSEETFNMTLDKTEYLKNMALHIGLLNELKTYVVRMNMPNITILLISSIAMNIVSEAMVNEKEENREDYIKFCVKEIIRILNDFCESYLKMNHAIIGKK